MGPTACKNYMEPTGRDLGLVTSGITDWNITSVAGKEPELVLQVERYQLDIM